MILEILYKGLIYTLFYLSMGLFVILRGIISLIFLTSIIAIMIYYPIVWFIGLFLKGKP